jgi:hypothetical protein
MDKGAGIRIDWSSQGLQKTTISGVHSLEVVFSFHK